jgi:hypothetical protein
MPSTTVTQPSQTGSIPVRTASSPTVGSEFNRSLAFCTPRRS